MTLWGRRKKPPELVKWDTAQFEAVMIEARVEARAVCRKLTQEEIESVMVQWGESVLKILREQEFAPGDAIQMILKLDYTI